MSKEADKPSKTHNSGTGSGDKPPAKSPAKTASTKASGVKSPGTKSAATKASGTKTKAAVTKPKPAAESKAAAPTVTSDEENNKKVAGKPVVNKPVVKKKTAAKAKSPADSTSKPVAIKKSGWESKASAPITTPPKPPQVIITAKAAASPPASAFVARQGATSGSNLGWARLRVYGELMRLHRPIGILLLLWPTLWSLWLAAEGIPRWDLLIIFTLGVVVMRSAGCVINDYADRKIDGSVRRTRDRPLARGAVTSREALILFAGLCLLALALVLLTNRLTILLAFGGLLLAGIYPFMKRHTYLPQVVLGAAFAWSIPMAFAAQRGELVHELWLIYVVVVIWTVVYDTFYAMVDREDDRRIGVKSTAILFGEQDRLITGFLQLITLYGLILIGSRFELGMPYYGGMAAAAGLFAYQQYLIRFRDRDACFAAFLNNHWVGLVVFAGIAADFALRSPA